MEETEAAPDAKPEKKSKKEKKEKKPSKAKTKGSRTSGLEILQQNTGVFLLTFLSMVIVMGAMFAAVFFWVVKSPEQVLVPNVVGDPLEEALMKLQVKELYPKITLRYSNSADEKGSILEQSPSSGTIVKAGRRISLVVSRGIIVDRVGDYVGQKLDDVRITLQTLFSGSAVQQIKLSDTPLYQADESEPGTILEQDPPPDTAINSPVTVQVVVSSGPGNETTRVPWIVGMSLNDALLQMSRSKIIFHFTSKLLEEGRQPGVVLSQKAIGGGEPVPVYSVVDAVISMPDKVVNDNVYGIFTESLPAYPYALKVQLDVIPQEGDPYTLVTLKHTGGELTIPYAVPRFSVLVLKVQDQEMNRYTVQ